jgi:hypothetical protein
LQRTCSSCSTCLSATCWSTGAHAGIIYAWVFANDFVALSGRSEFNPRLANWAAGRNTASCWSSDFSCLHGSLVFVGTRSKRWLTQRSRRSRLKSSSLPLRATGRPLIWWVLSGARATALQRRGTKPLPTLQSRNATIYLSHVTLSFYPPSYPSQTFGDYKTRGPVVLKPSDTAELIEKLEDSQMQLGSMATNRLGPAMEKGPACWEWGNAYSDLEVRRPWYAAGAFGPHPSDVHACRGTPSSSSLRQVQRAIPGAGAVLGRQAQHRIRNFGAVAYGAGGCGWRL